jgi:hypothetical protein
MDKFLKRVFRLVLALSFGYTAIHCLTPAPISPIFGFWAGGCAVIALIFLAAFFNSLPQRSNKP